MQQFISLLSPRKQCGFVHKIDSREAWIYKEAGAQKIFMSLKECYSPSASSLIHCD